MKIQISIFRTAAVLFLCSSLSACGYKHNIHAMAEKGDIRGVIRYLDHQGDVNLETGKVWPTSATAHLTPLHFAIMGDQYDMAKLLIERGANINAISVRGSPLYLATNLASADIMGLLLSHGADRDLPKPKGGSLLHLAISSYGLSAGDIRKTRNSDRRARAAKLLLKYGFAVDSRDKDGRTPFMRAVERHNLAAMELLKKNGADIHRHDDKGENALFMVSTTRFARKPAERIKEYDIFTWLLEQGLDPLHENIRGETLLHKNCNVKITQHLLAHNINPGPSQDGIEERGKNRYSR